MKKFKFISEYIIEAENEEQAKMEFADNSFNFAADAECVEVTKEDQNNKAEKYLDSIEFKQEITDIGNFEFAINFEKKDILKLIKQVQIDAYNNAI